MNYLSLHLIRELNEELARDAEKEKKKEKKRCVSLEEEKKIQEKRKLQARHSQKKWRQRNPERARFFDERWRKNNPDKVRLKAFRRKLQKQAAKGEFTKEDLQRLSHAQKNLCLKCKKPFTEDRPYTIDHIIPLSKGGRNDLSNLQLLHRSCNSEKHTNVIDYRTRIMKRRIFEQLPLWTAGRLL